MRRITPPPEYYGEPCSIVGIDRATGVHPTFKASHADGYMTLKDQNKFVRQLCKVKKYTYYKRSERPKLKDLHIQGKALVCVYGHFLYLEGETYWSFFNNENDDVVAVWELNE